MLTCTASAFPAAGRSCCSLTLPAEAKHCCQSLVHAAKSGHPQGTVLPKSISIICMLNPHDQVFLDRESFCAWEYIRGY